MALHHMTYSSAALAMSTGAHPCPCGNLCVFKPWFFDGKAVHWGPTQETESAALALAEKIKEKYG
jgi:hypothetical protein